MNTLLGEKQINNCTHAQSNRKQDFAASGLDSAFGSSMLVPLYKRKESSTNKIKVPFPL